jgi:hypothetical protein
MDRRKQSTLLAISDGRVVDVNGLNSPDIISVRYISNHNWLIFEQSWQLPSSRTRMRAYHFYDAQTLKSIYQWCKPFASRSHERMHRVLKQYFLPAQGIC